MGPGTGAAGWGLRTRGCGLGCMGAFGSDSDELTGKLK